MKELIAKICTSVWAIVPSAAVAASLSPALLSTCCGFFQAYTWIYAFAKDDAEARGMLERTISFLLACIPATQTSLFPSSKNEGEEQNTSKYEREEYMNSAGVAFRAMCREQQIVARTLVCSPQMLNMIMQVLFPPTTAGVSASAVPAQSNGASASSAVTHSMRSLWMSGLATLIPTIGFSEDVLKELSASAQSNTLNMSAQYLSEFAAPVLNGIERALSALASVPAGGSRAGADALTSLTDSLDCLGTILQQVAAPGDRQLLQNRELIHERVNQLQQQTGSAPSSIASNTLTRAWPLIERCVPLFVQAHDESALDTLIAIYQITLDLLWRHELAGVLQTILQQASHIYNALPIVSCLALFQHAIEIKYFAQDKNRREMWHAMLTHAYRGMRLHTQVSSKCIIVRNDGKE